MCTVWMKLSTARVHPVLHSDLMSTLFLLIHTWLILFKFLSTEFDRFCTSYSKVSIAKILFLG